MKKKLHALFGKKITLTFGVILLLVHSLLATNDINHIIITGQVLDNESGIPLTNHLVYIQSDKNTPNTHKYFNVVQTNNEGIFIDSISTGLHKGSMIVYTQSEQGETIQSDVHFRFFNRTKSNVFVINFSIDGPSDLPQLQARFKVAQKAFGDRFRFKFIDLSKNDRINGWKWDFGDGNFSQAQNPEHVYQKPGLYKVKLTIQAAIDRGLETSVISRMIYISDIVYNHLGGHCFAGYFPIDEGRAFLYKVVDENMLVSMDTATIDTLGYYYFYQVPEGQYCVKAQPDKRSSAYGSMIPTYYGDEPYWEKSTFIEHQETDWEYDINLVAGGSYKSGSGSISGKVSLKGGSRSAEGDLASEVDVHLFDENNNLLLSHYTDTNHDFSFESLGMGTYWISHEVAGLVPDRIKIELTNDKPSVSDIEIRISHPEYNMYLEESLAKRNENVGHPYPNPASNQITIDINSEINDQALVQILNLQGTIMRSQHTVLNNGLNKAIVKTVSLKHGIYLLRVNAGGEITQRTFVVNR